MERNIKINEDSQGNSSSSGTFAFFNDFGSEVESLNPGEFANLVINGNPDNDFVFRFRADERFKQEFTGKGLSFFRFQVPAGFNLFFTELFEPGTGFTTSRQFSSDNLQAKAG